MSMDKFFTREKSNTGIVIKLPLPDGSPSGETVTIAGKYSDLYRQKEAEYKREALKAFSQAESMEEKHQISEEIEIKLLSHLVLGWSFEDVEFNIKNVRTLLKEAPQIRELIDESVGNNALFFGKSSINSSSTAKDPSNSKESQKDQTQASENT